MSLEVLSFRYFITVIENRLATAQVPTHFNGERIASSVIMYRQPDITHKVTELGPTLNYTLKTNLKQISNLKVGENSWKNMQRQTE